MVIGFKGLLSAGFAASREIADSVLGFASAACFAAATFSKMASVSGTFLCGFTF
jgi:hypothetical protein